MITSLDNGQVKLAASLKTRAGRAAEGMFLLEGEKLIKEAASSGYVIERVFVEEEASERYFEYIKNGAAVVSAPVLKKICDTQTPQGIAAVARMKRIEPADLSRLIVLENMQDPGNYGTILRTAESFDFDAVVTVGTKVDCFGPRILRASMGSALRMPRLEFADINEAFDFFAQKRISVYAAVLAPDAIGLDEADIKQPCAIAVGNEAAGLTGEFSKRADARIIIPMGGKTESLNAAVAASILMWEIYKNNKK